MRSLGPVAGTHEESQGLDALHATGPVVLSARAQIPAVQVAAHQRNLLRASRAAPLAHHVVRSTGAAHFASQGELHAQIGVLFQFRRQPIGVLGTDARGGDFNGGIAVAHGSRVREIVGSEGQRPHQNRNSAVLARLLRAGPALVARVSVGGAGIDVGRI